MEKFFLTDKIKKQVDDWQEAPPGQADLDLIFAILRNKTLGIAFFEWLVSEKSVQASDIIELRKMIRQEFSLVSDGTNIFMSPIFIFWISGCLIPWLADFTDWDSSKIF